MTTTPAPGAEEIQWRNIRKVVRELADFCFGTQDDAGTISLRAAHRALVNALTAKDGLSVQLEPLPAAAAVPASEPAAYIWSYKAYSENSPDGDDGYPVSKLHSSHELAASKPDEHTPLYIAAHAPVSGMPDLAKLARYDPTAMEEMFGCGDGEYVRLADVEALFAAPRAPVPVSGAVVARPDPVVRVTIAHDPFGQEKLIQWAMLAKLPQGTHDLFMLPSPQASDTPVAPERHCAHPQCCMLAEPGHVFCRDCHKRAATLPAAPAPTAPSTLGQQVARAKAEMAKWSPELRASVRLQGGDEATPAEQAGELPPLPWLSDVEIRGIVQRGGIRYSSLQSCDEMAAIALVREYEEKVSAALAARQAPAEAPKEPLTEQQVADMMKPEMLTDIGYRAMLNGERIRVDLSWMTGFANFILAARQAPDSRDALIERAAKIAMDGPLLTSAGECLYFNDNCKAMALMVENRIRDLKGPAQ